MSSEPQVNEIWIEAETWRSSEWDPNNDSTDVIVTLEDGSRWGATFVAYQYVQTRAEQNKRTGECLWGKYLWVSEMILVDEVSRSSIKEVIQHLFTTGEFTRVFRTLE